MITFETVNELTLKVTCKGNDVLFTKAGAFIAGNSTNGKNYKFEKVLLGPQNNFAQAALGSLVRRVTGENLPLMKVTMNGDSVTYYANLGQHVVVYKLAPGETISLESENILAFTSDCDYKVRFIGCGILSQKGLCLFYTCLQCLRLVKTGHENGQFILVGHNNVSYSFLFLILL